MIPSPQKDMRYTQDFMDHNRLREDIHQCLVVRPILLVRAAGALYVTHRFQFELQQDWFNSCPKNEDLQRGASHDSLTAERYKAVMSPCGVLDLYLRAPLPVRLIAQSSILLLKCSYPVVFPTTPTLE